MPRRRSELRRGTPLASTPTGAPRRSSPIARRARVAPISDKRRALLNDRATVIAQVKARDRGCVGPRRGLPGRCTPGTEVHEVIPRGRDSTSWLDVDRCVELCRFHHDAVTSAHGPALELARAAGLDLPAEPLPQPPTFPKGRP
jgi:hypothetical protein